MLPKRLRACSELVAKISPSSLEFVILIVNAQWAKILRPTWQHLPLADGWGYFPNSLFCCLHVGPFAMKICSGLSPLVFLAQWNTLNGIDSSTFCVHFLYSTQSGWPLSDVKTFGWSEQNLLQPMFWQVKQARSYRHTFSFNNQHLPLDWCFFYLFVWLFGFVLQDINMDSELLQVTWDVCC